MFLITVDLQIEKDLNGQELRMWINNGTIRLVDMETLDEKKYVQNLIDDYEDYNEDYICSLLEEYNCTLSELAEMWLEDKGIEEIIGDLFIREMNNKKYGFIFYSIQGLDSIIKGLKDNQRHVLFFRAYNIIKELEKFEKKDLGFDDLYKIGMLLNKLVKHSESLEEILESCDLLYD